MAVTRQSVFHLGTCMQPDTRATGLEPARASVGAVRRSQLQPQPAVCQCMGGDLHFYCRIPDILRDHRDDADRVALAVPGGSHDQRHEEAFEARHCHIVPAKIELPSGRTVHCQGHILLHRAAVFDLDNAGGSRPGGLMHPVGASQGERLAIGEIDPEADILNAGRVEQRGGVDSDTDAIVGKTGLRASQADAHVPRLATCQFKGLGFQLHPPAGAVVSRPDASIVSAGIDRYVERYGIAGVGMVRDRQIGRLRPVRPEMPAPRPRTRPAGEPLCP